MSIAERDALIDQFKQVWVNSTADDRQIVQLAHAAYVGYTPAFNAIPYLRRAAELKSSFAGANDAVRAALDAVETEHAALLSDQLFPTSQKEDSTREKINTIFDVSPFWQQRRQLEEAVEAHFKKELSGIANFALTRAIDLDLSVTIPLLRGFSRAKAGDPDLLTQRLLRQGAVKAGEMERLLIQWNVDRFLEFQKELEEPKWEPPTYSSGDRHYWARASYDEE